MICPTDIRRREALAWKASRTCGVIHWTISKREICGGVGIRRLVVIHALCAWFRLVKLASHVTSTESRKSSFETARSKRAVKTVNTTTCREQEGLAKVNRTRLSS